MHTMAKFVNEKLAMNGQDFREYRTFFQKY